MAVQRAAKTSAEASAGPFTFKLKCSRCGGTQNHTVRRFMVDQESKDDHEVHLGRVIVCPSCGAEDEYELTPDARMTAIAAILSVTAGKERPTVNDPVAFGRPVLKDGFRYRRPSEAIRHMRQWTRNHPEDGDAWVRLGNFLRRHERAEEALEAYRHAERMDGSNLDALLNLTTLMLDLNRVQEACEFLRKGVEAVPPAETGLRKATVPALVGLLKLAVRSTRDPVWLHAIWMAEPTTATLSAVDLRRLKRWDRLEEFLVETDLTSLVLCSDGPSDRPTILEKKLEGDRVRGTPDVVLCERKSGLNLKPVGPISRNAPCPCGSGRKFKRCCGK